MTIQITIGLVILIVIAGFIFKNRIAKTNLPRNEKKVLMNNGKPILKQFSDLAQADFNEYPVWVQCHIIDYDEKWYDDTDEETFRPWIDKIPVSPDYAIFLVKAYFILNNGDNFNGFLTPVLKPDYKHENDLGSIQPRIFITKNDMAGFWTGMYPYDSKIIENIYKSFDKETDQIFPIKFKTVDGLVEGETFGIINGFLTIGEDDTVIVTK